MRKFFTKSLAALLSLLMVISSSVSLFALCAFAVEAPAEGLPVYGNPVLAENFVKVNQNLDATQTDFLTHDAVANYSCSMNDGRTAKEGSVVDYSKKTCWYSFYIGNEGQTTLADPDNHLGRATFDLGTAKPISEVAMQVSLQFGDADYVKAFASVNNTDWLEVGTFDIDHNNKTAQTVSIVFPNEITARYWKFEFKTQAMFYMVSEIMVYEYRVKCAGSFTDTIPAETFYKNNAALNKNVKYDLPDHKDYHGSITDGKEPGEEIGSDWRAVAANALEESAVIDLGEVKTRIGSVEALVWPKDASGIKVPDSIEIYASCDEVTYIPVGTLTTCNGNNAQILRLDFDRYLTARYIKMTVRKAKTGGFVFVGEVKVNEFTDKCYGNEIPVHIYKDNVALNKNVEYDLPDHKTYKGSITDGYKPGEGFVTTWRAMAANALEESAVIDLGEVKTHIGSVEAFIWPCGKSGVKPADSIEIYASMDGNNFVSVGTLSEAKGNNEQTVKLTLDKYLKVRYIKITVRKAETSGFVFVGEVFVNEHNDCFGDETPVKADKNNVALHKTVEYQYQPQGIYNGDLTDGIIEELNQYSDKWRSFHELTENAVIDLGEVRTHIGSLEAYVWPCGAAGVKPADSIEISASVDGKNFAPVGKFNDAVGMERQWIELNFDRYLTARYIKMTVNKSYNGHVFVGEVKVNEHTKSAEPEVILGDLDGNKIFDGLDVVAARQIDASKVVATEEQKLAGDVDGNGIFNGLDVSLMVQRDAGKITEWPVTPQA